ncbi:MAG: hypothetical protein ACLTL6_10215 [Holdemanella porci]
MSKKKDERQFKIRQLLQEHPKNQDGAVTEKKFQLNKKGPNIQDLKI